MRDNLPSKPWKKESGIVNLHCSFQPGSHWVAYFKKGDDIKYFDSFGNLQPPVELINYLGNKIAYNYIQYQRYNSFNCGHLCLRFLYDCYYK